MRRNKYLLFLTAVLIGLSMACMPAFSAEGMNISLMFSDGTAIQPEAVPGMPDAYWAVVGINTPKNQVLLRFEEQAGMRYSPKSGSYVSFPDAGSRLSSAAYLPLQCMDAQGNVVRTIRLYVSSAAYVLDSEEETLNLSAVLKEDAPVLDSNGQPHALSGTLAKGTVVRVTGKRESEQGPLCRVELNGELVYLSEAALSFDAPELAMSLDQLFSPENPEDHGFTCAVTTYEAGIRSGKGNTDKNLLGRVSKNTLVFVFSRMSDDDGKLLDLVYCPELGLFGYIHDTQLRILTSEEAESQFTATSEEEQNTEFQEAAVQTDTRLYSYPDQNSAVIAELPRGKAVYAYTRITGADENWYLAQADFRAVLRSGGAYLAAVLRLLAIPGTVLCGMWALGRMTPGLDRTMMVAIVASSSAPAAALTTMLAARYGRDVPMSVINDVKQALRQSYALNISYAATEKTKQKK